LRPGELGGEDEGLDQLLDGFAPAELGDVGFRKLEILIDFGRFGKAFVRESLASAVYGVVTVRLSPFRFHANQWDAESLQRLPLVFGGGTFLV
jgi:hypothetical protein